MSTAEPFAVPVGWRRTRHGDVVVATRPGPSPARLELRTGSGPAYDALEVEDEDAFELAGHPVDYRRFGHRVDGVELLSEEWTWRVEGGPLVLTGTVRREDYLSVCDLFEDVAATVTVQVGGRPAQPSSGTCSPAARRRSRSAVA